MRDLRGNVGRPRGARAAMLTGGCARALDANGARNGFKNKEIHWFGNEVWSPGGFRVPPVRSDVAAPVGGRQQRGPDTPPGVGGRALTLCSSLFRRSGSPTRTLRCGSDPPRETCSPGLRTQTGDAAPRLRLDLLESLRARREERPTGRKRGGHCPGSRGPAGRGWGAAVGPRGQAATKPSTSRYVW